MMKRTVAAAELVLLLPGAVFMTALMVRNVTPLPNEPAATAQRIVMWYAHLPPPVALWGMLCAMPLAVVVLGSAALGLAWRREPTLPPAVRQTVAALRAHWATAWIAAATLGAAAILAFVAVHMLTD